MDTPKQILGRSRSHGNLWSGVNTRLYSARGNYYVNVNILASRGAISLDETGWGHMVIGSKGDSENVYEPVLKTSRRSVRINTHDYESVRIGKMEEAAPRVLDPITDSPPNMNDIRRPVTGAEHHHKIPSCNSLYPADEESPVNGQRKGASKLLRSLKKFKQRLLTAKKGREQKLFEEYTSERDTTREGHVPLRTTKQATVVKVTNQTGTYIYASSKTKPEIATENEFGKGSPLASHNSETYRVQSSRSTDSRSPVQAYPDIVQSHGNTNHKTSRDLSTGSYKMEWETVGKVKSHGTTGQHIYETNPQMNRPRKSNLRRQMVIRLPSSTKGVQPSTVQCDTAESILNGGIYDQNCGTHRTNEDRSDHPYHRIAFQNIGQIDFNETSYANAIQHKSTTLHSFLTDRHASNRKSFHSLQQNGEQYSMGDTQSGNKPPEFVSNRSEDRVNSSAVHRKDIGYVIGHPNEDENSYSTGDGDSCKITRGLNTPVETTPFLGERKTHHSRSRSTGAFPASHSPTTDFKEPYYSCVRPSTPQLHRHHLELQIFQKEKSAYPRMARDSSDADGGFPDRHTRSQSQKIIRRHKAYKKFNHSNQCLDNRFLVAEVLV